MRVEGFDKQQLDEERYLLRKTIEQRDAALADARAEAAAHSVTASKLNAALARAEAAAEADGGASMQRLATLAAVARVKELEAQHDLDREFEMQGFQTAKARVASLEEALGEAAKELHQAATYLRAFGTPDVWQQADAAVAHARSVLEETK